MKLALLALTLSTAVSGCVTTAALVQKQDVKLPLLIGATVGDLVVSSVAASQVQDYSYGASLATGLAITAVDFAVGCLLGGCSSLRL
jgi:FtsH-binding integral membrane protein